MDIFPKDYGRPRQRIALHSNYTTISHFYWMAAYDCVGQLFAKRGKRRRIARELRWGTNVLGADPIGGLRVVEFPSQTPPAARFSSSGIRRHYTLHPFPHPTSNGHL